MPQPQDIVDDIAALKAIDMSGVNEFPLRFHVRGKDADYMYDSADTTTANDEWCVAPTTGNGRWHPIGAIQGSLNPSGTQDILHPITYYRGDFSSAPFIILSIHVHPGGGNNQWRTVLTSN